MEAAADSELDRSLFINSDSVSEASNLQESKSKRMMLQDKPEGTGTPMVTSGGPMKSNVSGSSDAGTGNIVGVERDLESSAYKKQGIGPNANMPLGELQNQHVEGCNKYASGLQKHESYTPQVMEIPTTEVDAYQGGVAQSHKTRIKQLLSERYVPRKYVELALATKNSEIEALKKQLIQSESDLAIMQVQNSLLIQELQNVKKKQRLSEEETNHMLQEEFSEKVEQCKVANCSNRLCDLPNELLLHILSFLEVKDAAQTSLSCKRLGQLWALVPDLHFKESDLCKRSLFLDFVERACALRGRLPMRAFSLNCEVEGAVVRVKKLIESVITSGVRDLSLVFSNYKRAYLLPSSIFTCASLEMLCVESLCLLQLPSICLPKLKVLILRNVMFEDNETLEKLFSTPSLEKLDYKEGWNGSIKSSSCARPCIRVTGPKLQHLSLNMFRCSRSTIEINGTPLKSFHYRGWFVDTHCVLEDTNQLIEAYLWSDDHIHDDNRNSCHAFKLLHLFSNVKEFTLFSSLSLVCLL
ncbi:hypothetical protein DM860_010747 [Cuscuta australis]|uniref:F-box domain-containing protein n=1 Tax=Cuscuta australis TaxID=267555 RepID=A0A328DZS8_9ASTE|nr:hypothetical protein DM860_010747 [Cuscuta australis]